MSVLQDQNTSLASDEYPPLSFGIFQSFSLWNSFAVCVTAAKETSAAA